MCKRLSLSLTHVHTHQCTHTNTHILLLTSQFSLFAVASPAAGFPSLPLPLVSAAASGLSTLPPYSSFLLAPPEVEPAHASAAHPTAPGPCEQPGEGMCVYVWRRGGQHAILQQHLMTVTFPYSLIPRPSIFVH